jgi:hypothetical protein
LQSETKVNGFVTTGDVAKQGAGTGALFGSLLGLLSGAAFLFVPAFGPLVVLRPLAAALAGAGGGAIVGGVIGAIFGKFIFKQRIPKLEQQVKAGKYGAKGPVSTSYRCGPPECAGEGLVQRVECGCEVAAEFVAFVKGAL